MWLIAAAGSPGGAAYDEKNIRRRVYDALNVLMAMDIITKDKKEISWQGLPPAPASTLEKLKAEKARLIAKLHQQHAYLKVCAQCCIAVTLCNFTMTVEIYHRSLLVTHAENLIFAAGQLSVCVLSSSPFRKCFAIGDKLAACSTPQKIL